MYICVCMCVCVYPMNVEMQKTLLQKIMERKVPKDSKITSNMKNWKWGLPKLSCICICICVFVYYYGNLCFSIFWVKFSLLYVKENRRIIFQRELKLKWCHCQILSFQNFTIQTRPHISIKKNGKNFFSKLGCLLESTKLGNGTELPSVLPPFLEPVGSCRTDVKTKIDDSTTPGNFFVDFPVDKFNQIEPVPIPEVT